MYKSFRQRVKLQDACGIDVVLSTRSDKVTRCKDLKIDEDSVLIFDAIKTRDMTRISLMSMRSYCWSHDDEM